MQKMEKKLDDIQEGQHDILEGQQRIEGAVLDLSQRIEAVRKTVVNLDAEQVPMACRLELCPKDTAEVTISHTEARSLFDRLRDLFKKTNDLNSVQDHIDKLGGQKLKLRLLCQKTWEPVGVGYELDTPRDQVPKLLPLLGLGMQGSMPEAIGTFFLGSLVAEVPTGVVQDAEELVAELPTGLYNYPCVTGHVISPKSNPEAMQLALDRFQQEEFRSFLQTVDRDEVWRSHLSKTPLANGTVLWVSKEGYKELEDEKLLDTESERLQTKLEEAIAAARHNFDKKLEAEIGEKQAEIHEREAAIKQLVQDVDQTEQRTDEELERVKAELRDLRESYQEERRVQSQHAEALQRQFDQLHRQKMESLEAEDTNASEQAEAMMGDLAKEASDEADRVAAARQKQKEKLRARLEAKRKQ
jgi:hypothetical protein